MAGDISYTQALNAYKDTARAMAEGQVPGIAEKDATGPSFASFVTDNLGGAMAESRQAEHIAMRGMAGEASLAEVVTAVNNADLTLRTVNAIRNKVVEAYQRLLQTPI